MTSFELVQSSIFSFAQQEKMKRDSKRKAQTIYIMVWAALLLVDSLF
jgi:hypothetical protein